LQDDAWRVFALKFSHPAKIEVAAEEDAVLLASRAEQLNVTLSFFIVSDICDVMPGLAQG